MRVAETAASASVALCAFRNRAALVQMRAYERHGCGGHSRDPGRLAERGRPNLREPIHHFPGQPWNSREHEIHGNWPRFLPPLPIDDNRLPPEIPFVFELGFNAGNIDCRIAWFYLQTHLPLSREVGKPNIRLLEGASGRQTLSGRKSDCGPANRFAIAVEPRTARLKSLPALVVTSPMS